MEKEIVILAKSIKNGGFCIAGKDVNTNEWIRPVSTINGGELSNEQSKSYFHNEDGNLVGYPCKILQKVRINFSEAVPLPYQCENYLIDNSRWMQNYKETELVRYLDRPQALWGINSDYINSVDLNTMNPNGNSLYLIQVSNIALYVHNAFDRRNRRVSFTYNGLAYDLKCTDPNFDIIIGGNSRIQFDSAILCISLGMPFSPNPPEIRHYKLVATIHLPER